jgi:hypothetical protein
VDLDCDWSRLQRRNGSTLRSLRMGTLDGLRLAPARQDSPYRGHFAAHCLPQLAWPSSRRFISRPGSVKKLSFASGTCATMGGRLSVAEPQRARRRVDVASAKRYSPTSDIHRQDWDVGFVRDRAVRQHEFRLLGHAYACPQQDMAIAQERVVIPWRSSS